MTAHARTRSRAGRILRTLTGATTAVLALLATACGSSNTELGTPVVTLTVKNGGFSSYIINVSGITFTRDDGGVYYSPLYSTSERADLTQLKDIIEVLQVPAAPTGNYVSATLTLDYTSITPAITANVNGTNVSPTLVNDTGAALTTTTLNIKFDPSNPLVINQGKSSPVHFEVDLAASNLLNTSASTPTLTVQPFATVTANPTYDKPLHARGLFVTADTSAGTFTFNTRPLHDLVSAIGAITVRPAANAYYNINGVAYANTAAGLPVIAKLNTTSSQIAVVGTFSDLTGITPVFTATEVYAGTSLESTIADQLNGHVSAISGNTVTVRNASIVTRGVPSYIYGQTTFAGSVAVKVGSSTIVSQDGAALSSPSTGLISVGQRVTVLGQVPADTVSTPNTPVTMDATGGQVRLMPTEIWGNATQVTPSLTLNLLSFGIDPVAQYNFAGTGVDPTNYVVAATSTGSATVSSLVKAIGVMNSPVPPDFTASTVTADGDLVSTLVVEWPSGTTAPFTSASATSGLVVDLSNTNLGTVHLIQTGPTSTDLKTLTASPAILLSNATVLALGTAASTISAFNSATPFASSLSSTVNGTNKFIKLVAMGKYDASNNSFNATKVNLNLQ